MVSPDGDDGNSQWCGCSWRKYSSPTFARKLETPELDQKLKTPESSLQLVPVAGYYFLPATHPGCQPKWWNSARHQNVGEGSAPLWGSWTSGWLVLTAGMGETFLPTVQYPWSSGNSNYFPNVTASVWVWQLFKLGPFLWAWRPGHIPEGAFDLHFLPGGRVLCQTKSRLMKLVDKKT